MTTQMKEHKDRRQPAHVAIVMDGNGRWAKQRKMPRVAGHRVGAKAVRRALRYCVQQGIPVLSIFALSTENFTNRPPAEVKFLLTLFSNMLTNEIDELDAENIRIRIIGDTSVFSESLQRLIQNAQTRTQTNSGPMLVIAANYSGRWDILQAARKAALDVVASGANPMHLTEADYAQHLCLSDLPEPDLLIRTSGEQRISNFMLWQLAYSELCFLDEYWPDFDEHVFEKAIDDFCTRNRRFGYTGEQITEGVESC